MLFYVKRSLAFGHPPIKFLAPTNGLGNGIFNGHRLSTGVAGKTPGGKSGHPIRGMAV